GGRRRKCEVPPFYPRIFRKVLAGVLVSQNGCARSVQPFIPIGVVEVPVRVDQVLDWIGANARESVGNLRAGAGKSGIANKLTVATGKHGDIASSAHQNAHVVAESLHCDRGAGCSFSCFFYETGGRHRVRKGKDTT